MKVRFSQRRKGYWYSGLAMIVLGMAVVSAQSATYPDIPYTGPSPMPAFPAEFSAFDPPVHSNPVNTGAPAIAEWTRSNEPGDTLALSAGGMPTSYVIHAPGYIKAFRTENWFGDHGAVTLPADLPDNEMYFLWPVAAGVTGTPVAINQTESWWLTETTSVGGLFSIFGRNLGTGCKVWVEEKNQWLDAVACNPYKADFRVPSNYANGTYTLWAHNGKGGKYGWADSLSIEVTSPDPWDENKDHWFDVSDYGALGDGSSDDLSEIEAAIDAALADGDWNTVYFPAGDYRISAKLDIDWNGSRLRLIGEGMDLVTIQPHANSSAQTYVVHTHGDDLQFKNMTLAANSHGGEQIVRFDKECERLLLENVRLNQIDAVMSYPARPGGNGGDEDTMTSDKILGVFGVTGLRLVDCEFIQKANVMVDANASQIFISNCTFIGSWDANTLFDISDSKEVSIVDSIARNLDDTRSDGDADTFAWCQGRWIHGKGGFRDFYIGGSTTENMTPRTGYPDPNVGEQVMFEFAKTYFRGKPASAAANTLTFGATPDAGVVGLIAVVQSGPGQGQNRVITGLSGTTITVDRDWLVEPTTDSSILIGDFAKNVAIYDNYFDGRPRALGSSFVGSAGIEAYGGCVDLVADKNHFHELRFPYNVQSKHATYDGRKDYEPNFFNLYINGIITNCYHGIAMYVEREPDAIWSYAQVLGNVYRKNFITGLAAEPLHYHGDFSSGSTSQQMDMQVFDSNTYTNYTGSITEYVRITESEVINQVMVEASTIALPPPPDPPPAPVLTGIAITGPSSVDEGASAQYVCTASYSDGATTQVIPNWTEDSSSADIDGAGVLSSGDVAADESLTVTASYGAFTETHNLTIRDIPVVLTGITISGPSNVDEGSTAQYICTASYSDGTSATVVPTWSANSASATINSSGLLSALNVTADHGVTLTASYGGQADTHIVTIKYIPPVLTSITISGSASVNEGSTAQYTCTASYSDGTSEAADPAWSENSATATINSSGLLSALNVTSDQSVTITASLGGQTDTHSVTIKYIPPVLTGIAISGPTSVNEESSAQYTCTASYSDGTSEVVAPAWSENSESAAIDGNGLLNALNVTADQSATITAGYGGKSDTHAVTITYVAPVLTSIVITGPASVAEEATAQYTCTASYSDGTSEVVTPDWSENSSFTTINASGLLSVGDVSANQSVTVDASYGGKRDTHPVSIAYVPPTVTGITISGPASIGENTTAQYVCTAHYSDGSTAPAYPAWSEDSASASINGSGLLSTGNIAADEQVTVQASYDGKVAAQTLTIMAVGDQIVYQLSGFDGKTVSAELWDDVTQTTTDLGEEFEPEEIVIENVKSEQWYWLGLREYDAQTGEWVLVLGRWLWM